MGWAGLIRVDGTTYNWLGNAATIPNVQPTQQLSQILTPTQTIFLVQAGPVQLNLTFLSPIEVRLLQRDIDKGQDDTYRPEIS